ncbi:MAG: hypothetical protein HY747_08100 [Elusimicrobia bacterium]|nr:hypothetical protein [Elusimicrobiota bacterium]
MPKSKAHKYFGKFQGWTRHNGTINAERTRAAEEFFINPAKIPKESVVLVSNLCEDWFLFDRRLTHSNKTPLELFIDTQQRKLPAKDLAIYRRFLETHCFGIFRAEDFQYGEWLDLKAMPDGKIHRVFDQTGSSNIEKGAYLIARLISFEDHWATSSFVASIPEESRYILDRGFGEKTKGLDAYALRPRDVLSFFMPKINWEEEGLPAVKAKMASILERCHTGITVSEIEKECRKAHQNRESEAPIFEKIIAQAPSHAQMREAMDVLRVFWNLTLPQFTPSLDKRTLNKGPKEMMLVRDMEMVVAAKLNEKDWTDEKQGLEASKAITLSWLDAPQKELAGKTPKEVILEEREALGNPQKEVGYLIAPSRIPIAAQAAEGERLANLGRKQLAGREPNKALETYLKAYKLLKAERQVSFRILGNIATCHAMLGDREKAAEYLRAALMVNPDYRVARDNLHILESMTPDEFQRLHREGFFNKQNLITEK